MTIMTVFLEKRIPAIIHNDMNKPIKREMRWFVSKLIDMREDTNITPTHIADINFDYEEIIKQKPIFSITNRAGAKSKIIEMLTLIKGDAEFLNKLNNRDKKLLKWKSLADSIKIKGYQIGLLKAYLIWNILKGEKIFGLALNNKKKQVITVYGENTGKRIETGPQYIAFCYFLKHPNKPISYLELFGEFKRSLPHEGEYYNIEYPINKDKEKFVQDTVYNLRRKLVEAGGNLVDVDKVLETIPKKGYRYNM
jgi:hypothetical protein